MRLGISSVLAPWALVAGVSLLGASSPAQAAPTTILFVGNSYTFGRIDPVMSYNAANVHDLTQSMALANATGSNAFEPHPWGGIAGIFKQFTVQAGLDYEVSISARNAASLRGHFLNTNTANWDLRGNIASQSWNKVVLQEQSDEPLPKQSGLASNPDYFLNYVDRIEDFIHAAGATSFRERDFFAGANATEQANACAAATGASVGTCNTLRSIPSNTNANAATDVYLYQTWARPNLINAPFTTIADPVTGAISFTSTPATSFYPSLEAMTQDLRTAYARAADLADNDGTRGITGIAPVGEAFLRAVTSGIATRNLYASNALSDNLIDLWFDDGTHASRYGSYLSALTLFGTITGLDPVRLGAQESAARDLGISSADAVALQRVASQQLGFAVPLPAGPVLVVLGLALMALRRAGLRRLRSMLVLVLASSVSPAYAAFPDKPLKIVVGQAAGGSSDLISRFVAEAASGPLGQRVVVENKPGMNGIIGADQVNREAADGYVIFQCPMSTMAISGQLIGARVPLDPGAELTPIANLVLSSYGLVVPPSSPFRSINDIVAAAKAKPGQLTFASPGPGSAQHLSGEFVKRLAGVDMVHVPYKGAAPALLDVIGGRIDFMITNLGDVARQVQAGQLRLLAQGDPSKFPLFPDLPRIADSLPGFEVTGWFGFCGPKGLAADALKRWEEVFRQLMQDPAFVRRLQDSGFTPLYEGTEAFTRRLEGDRRRWREVIQAGKVGQQ